jgi:isopenicillin-N N-acyltransferase like protein
MANQVENAIDNYLPQWLADLVANLGLDAALDFTEWATKEYTGAYFYEELRGIADGGNIDYKTLVRVHMIAGLTQGKCSMVGAWGAALAKNSATSLLQLRALDWDMDGPFRDFSAVTVQHPLAGDGHPFLTVGMVGFIGGLTGMSATQLGISEIGVAYPDATFGQESRVGYPFIFLLRDILQYDITIDDAINRMANAKRTCDLILGVGDGKMNEFRAFQYSSSVLNVMNDRNQMPLNATWHPRIPNIVYYGMDWVCPGYNLVLSRLLQKYYGSLTPEVGYQYITAMEQSGDSHLAWYDLTNMEIYLSFAAPHASTGPAEAYARQFAKFDVTALFNLAPPTDAEISPN